MSDNAFVSQVDALLARIPMIEAGGHVLPIHHEQGWMHGVGGINQPAHTEQVMEYNEGELRLFVSDVDILVGTIIADIRLAGRTFANVLPRPSRQAALRHSQRDRRPSRDPRA